MIRQSHEPPTWLEGRWAEQKHATATRIAGAIASLRQAGDKITYGSICRSVQSPYAIYSANRSSRQYSPAKEQALQKLLQNANDTQPNRVGSKIARLRRMRKDALIAMLLQLQDADARQKTTETNLRDEILRLVTSNIHDQRGQQGKGK
jgi:hypothetical protein